MKNKKKFNAKKKLFTENSVAYNCTEIEPQKVVVQKKNYYHCYPTPLCAIYDATGNRSVFEEDITFVVKIEENFFKVTSAFDCYFVKELDDTYEVIFGFQKKWDTQIKTFLEDEYVIFYEKNSSFDKIGGVKYFKM